MNSSTTAVKAPTATKRGKLSLPEKREFIKARLKRGDLTKIAKKMDTTPASVFYVIHGDGRYVAPKNPRKAQVQLLNAAYAYVYARKAQPTEI